MEAFIEYGDGLKTTPVKLKAGEPQNIVPGGFKPDTSYNYRLIYRRAGGDLVQDSMRSFHTQRKAGSTFSFVLQVDSHLDNNTDVRVYQQSLANMLADKPDFMIDLGDTTMVDKFGRFYTRSESQYKAQRYYMGRIAHSVPIFMVPGNHEGERGDRADLENGAVEHSYIIRPRR
jgi:hypothetical protein